MDLKEKKSDFKIKYHEIIYKRVNESAEVAPLHSLPVKDSVNCQVFS